MNVEEIIEKHLIDNGYDGLCGDECGCLVGDLFPCESNTCDCEPGYKASCKDECECDYYVEIGKG